MRAGGDRITSMRGQRRRGLARRASGFLLVWAVLVAVLLAFPRNAEAVPSFARQTGQPCAACHTAYPELTPFGRRFKLSGYTTQGGDSTLPPVAAMVMPTFTHTEAALDPGSQPPGTQTNNNLAVQQVTGFYAGTRLRRSRRLHSGDRQSHRQHQHLVPRRVRRSLRQVGNAVRPKHFVRHRRQQHADRAGRLEHDRPPSAFPRSALIFAAFSPPLTHIEAGWGQQVAGTGGYLWWNDMLYAELTGYMADSEKRPTGARRADRRWPQRSRALLASGDGAALGR